MSHTLSHTHEFSLIPIYIRFYFLHSTQVSMNFNPGGFGVSMSMQPPASGGPNYGACPPGQQAPYPAQQYPPQQAGYPPPQAGYPPPQTGYPPPQTGYPPQQTGYPPPQTGYPPAQAGYPPPQNPPQGGGGAFISMGFGGF